MRHGTPPEAASVAETEMMRADGEDIVSDELVVRVGEVVPGGLVLTLTIGYAIGGFPEVSRAHLVRDANHSVPEEMSSDTLSGALAGSRLDDDRVDPFDGRPAAAGDCGDVREVSTDIDSVSYHGAEEGMPSDALDDACAGVASPETTECGRVAASMLDGARCEADGADRLQPGGSDVHGTRAHMGSCEDTRRRALGEVVGLARSIFATRLPTH